MTDLLGEPRPWVLQAVFPDDDGAIAAATALATRAVALAQAAPSLLAEGRAIELVDELADVEGGLDEVAGYVSMRQYADASDESVQTALVAVRVAAARGRAALETALDAWRALADDAAGRVLAEPALAPAAYRLSRARAEARHRLEPSVEATWALRNETARDRWASLQELVEADARVMFDDGEGERPWGIGDLSMVLRRPDPVLRRAAWGALADLHGRTLGLVAVAWDAAVADRIAEDRLRRRAGPVAETLEREDMAPEGLSTLLEAVEGRADLLQSLLAAQPTLLGLDRLSVADLEAPVAGLPRLGYDEVVRIALAGLRSLHPVLEADGRALFAAERVDAETRPGKQQYAVAFATRLEPPAFIGFRMVGGASSVLTLGHELGHAVALARAHVAQPPIARGWPGVLLELPSLLAEIAAADALAGSYPEHAAGVGLALAQVLAWSVFEAMTFCRVELDLYERRSAGEALTAGVVVDAFTRRFGDAYGPALPITEADAVVLAGTKAGYAVSSRFYGFQYAVGALVALALLEQRPDDPAGFGERCVELLGLGRSAAPADQLARFGLDLGAATWATGLEALARRFAAVAPNRLPGPDETAMRQMPGG